MRNLFMTTFLLALPGLAMAEPPEPRHGPDELLERVKERHPEKYRRLIELRETNPHRFHQHMMSIRHHLAEGEDDPEARERMEAMRKLRKQFHDQVEAYEAAVGKAKEDLRAKLLEVAGQMFDARQEARKRRLEKAKARIEALESEIADRDENREAVIERFVDEATGTVLQGL